MPVNVLESSNLNSLRRIDCSCSLIKKNIWQSMKYRKIILLKFFLGQLSVLTEQ